MEAHEHLAKDQGEIEADIVAGYQRIKELREAGEPTELQEERLDRDLDEYKDVLAALGNQALEASEWDLSHQILQTDKHVGGQRRD